VLDGVSFTLPPGRCLAVVGESGSGKSTIIRAVLGLLGPTGGEISGSIRLAGEELVGRHPAELAAVRGKRVALVMQNPSTALNPMRTVGTQLIEPMRRHLGLSAAEARARAVELLGRVHVPDAERRMRAYPFELSGGMAQRVCVALALTGRPEVLLADEPTSSLDTTVSVEILDLLDELRATTGMAMLLVSHSLDVVAQRADDVLVLHAGRVAEVAPAATLFGTPAMPYTRALLAAAPRLANPPHTRLPTLPAGPGPLALQLPGCGFAPRCERADPDCHTSRPPLAPVRAGHEVACWHPVLEDGRTSLRSSEVPVTQA
jgi:peptide/nickel transport system permease protein